VRRPAVLIPVVAFLLGLASPAHANWGGESNCGWKEEPILEHCYSTTQWRPNVHKNIREVWTYVNGEDARFGQMPEPPEEFTTMETWVSWSKPGIKVEYPLAGPDKWVEAGENYGGLDGEVAAGECHPFHAAEFGENSKREYLGGEEEVLNVVCPSTKKQFFKFVKSPTSGEVRVFSGSNEIARTPEADLPSGPFTDLESGNEEATSNYPLGIKGSTESFAKGGKEDRWVGKVGSKELFYPQATCVNGDRLGTVEFSGGGDCPDTEKGTPFKQEEEGEGPEEGAARQQSVRTDVESSSEEGSEPGDDNEPAPQSNIDTFATYEAPSGTALSKEAIQAKAEQLATAVPGNRLESVKVHQNTELENAETNAEEVPLNSADMTAGQKSYMKSKVDLVEMVGEFGAIGNRTRMSEDVTGGYSTTHENLIYDRLTGALLRREWNDHETPREIAAREKKEEKCVKDSKKCTNHELCLYWHSEYPWSCTGRESCEYYHEECEHIMECEFYHTGCTPKEACWDYHEDCTPELACILYYEECTETKGDAKIASRSRKAPPLRSEEEDEEPGILEPTVVSGSGPVRDATVVVKHGHATVTKSRQAKINLTPGAYEVTARAAGYKCATREIHVHGKKKLGLRLGCSRG
jgi:hypothetical protein